MKSHCGVLGRSLALITCAAACGFSAFAAPQAPIKVQSEIVMVDVLAENKKTGDPIKDLAKDDFQLRVNGKSVDIAGFARGKDENLRPLQLWFVLVCNEERHYAVGGSRRRTQAESTDILSSSFLAGRSEQTLAPGLAHLQSADTVGVAHWCDNGESEIDFHPAVQSDAVYKAIDSIAGRKAITIQEVNDQDDPQKRLLALINSVSRSAFPQPVPAVIFVGGKRGVNDANRDSSSTGAMEFSFFDAGGTGNTSATEADSHYDVKNNQYGERLGSIIDILHSRYEVGFQPVKADKKQHRVAVTITAAARDRYPTAVLRYRDEYVEDAPPPALDAAKGMAEWKHLDSKMQAAVKNDPALTALVFTVIRGGSVPVPPEHGHAQPDAEKFLLKINPEDLTWRMLPNGDRRCVLSAVVAGYSSKGKPISVIEKDVEIIQAFEKLPKLQGKPMVFAVNAPVIKGAAKIRVVLRDVATGKMGTQDLQPPPEHS